MTKQCPSCGGICKPSGCEREHVTQTWMNSRKWQGLTEVEKNQFALWAHPDIIEAIELRLQERNT